MNIKSFEKRIAWEIGVLLLLAGMVFYFAGKYDALEWLADITRSREEWELDELITTAVFLSFAMTAFALRRWLESRKLLKLVEERNTNLENALKEIDYLKGILPICCACKKIRDHKGDWQSVEAYIEDHSKARFSHSMCPDCMDAHYGDEPWYKKRRDLPDSEK